MGESGPPRLAGRGPGSLACLEREPSELFPTEEHPMLRFCVTLLTLGVCAAAAAPAATGAAPKADRLNGGGSSFVKPMMDKWTSEYAKAKGVEVNYQSVGSGAGIEKMTTKDFDFGCTDAPMSNQQLDKAKGVGGEVQHVPLVM